MEIKAVLSSIDFDYAQARACHFDRTNYDYSTIIMKEKLVACLYVEQ